MHPYHIFGSGMRKAKQYTAAEYQSEILREFNICVFSIYLFQMTPEDREFLGTLICLSLPLPTIISELLRSQQILQDVMKGIQEEEEEDEEEQEAEDAANEELIVSLNIKN